MQAPHTTHTSLQIAGSPNPNLTSTSRESAIAGGPYPTNVANGNKTIPVTQAYWGSRCAMAWCGGGMACVSGPAARPPVCMHTMHALHMWTGQLLACCWPCHRYIGNLATTWDLSGNLLNCTGSPVLLGGNASANAVADNSTLASLIASLRAPIDALNALVVGSLATPLIGAADKTVGRNQETTAGDLVCDALLWGAQNTVGALRG